MKKLGNIPDGGGRRYLGRQQGDRNRQATRDWTRVTNAYRQPKVGTCFVPTVIDDYSRVAYAEFGRGRGGWRSRGPGAVLGAAIE